MNLNVQNIKTNVNYNPTFAASTCSKRAVKYVAPAICTVAMANIAQNIVKENETVGTFYYPYVPELNHSNKSAEDSAKTMIISENSKTGIFYYPYVPEHYHAAKSPEEAQKIKEDCIYALENDFRHGKFVKNEVTREGGSLFGRITKIVRYFEYPDYTWERTFDYSGPGSIKITSDFSRSGLKSIDVYEDGLRTETANIDKETGKYCDRQLYKYDSKGRVSERLIYSNTLQKIEYSYDSQNRIIGITTTNTAIPENERSEYSYAYNCCRMCIYHYEIQYDKDNNPTLVSITKEIELGNGEMWRQKELYPNDIYFEKNFSDPNKYTKLNTKHLYL